MIRSPRWLVGVLVVVLALAFVDCTPKKRRARRKADVPSATVTPRPARSKAPAPTRTPKPARDTSRDPLTNLVTANTSAP